jgi:hypothetical protein
MQTTPNKKQEEVSQDWRNGRFVWVGVGGGQARQNGFNEVDVDARTFDWGSCAGEARYACVPTKRAMCAWSTLGRVPGRCNAP